MLKPDVSVVMGVCNGMPHLGQAVSSILDQQGVSLELIVVDDGSTDGTLAFLEGAAKYDGRLRIVQQANSGLTRALIVGCDLARGDYIARQDSDDYSLPNRLSLQKSLLDESSELAFVSCLTNIVGPSGEFLYQSSRPLDPVAATSVLRHQRGGPVHGSVMMRREAYYACGGYRSEFYFSQDNDLWLRLADHGLLAYVSASLYCLRIHPSSISGSLHFLKVPFAEAVSKSYQARQSGSSDELILRRLTKLPTSRSSSSNLPESCFLTNYFIGSLLLRNRDRRSLKYLLASFSLSPVYFRALPKLPLAFFLQLTRLLRR